MIIGRLRNLYAVVLNLGATYRLNKFLFAPIMFYFFFLLYRDLHNLRKNGYLRVYV